MTKTADGPITEPAKKMLSKDEFISRLLPKTKVLSFPELGGDITIRSISAKDRDDIVSASTDKRTGKAIEHMMNALTLVKGVVDPVLTAVEVDALVKSDFTLVLRISNEIWSMSGGIKEIKND